ncbi:probable (S)-N-methylcoclaurine 3'-hydroxylase isozyme 2 [Quercus suber]|uniref:probable (S)-N-methylcoclaurine 3'-hydroxylase isozyme 2 n=1 Tax=Quercus suber TaxID=58331 RepID=UPI000CE2085D|nr:probable (S)-N-methylcoclaurine 3'-hydroxylase isozyme 2 [Quercus suber]
MGRQLHSILANLAKVHGPLMSLRLGTQISIIASSPEAAREVLKTHDRELSGRFIANAIPLINPKLNNFSLAAAPECNDYWRSLRAICKADLFSAKVLESQNHIREKKDLLIAGTDSRSMVTEWAMAELMRNQDVMHKLREEIESEIGTNIVKESHLSHLPYLEACVKETLRLYPPGPLLILHRALQTCRVMGYTIPKDSFISVNIWSIDRDPMVFNDPLSFKPKRFLDSSLDFKGTNFDYTPFGAGRRGCPGQPLATRQVPLILASLVHSLTGLFQAV